jgi:hypothetical protein
VAEAERRRERVGGEELGARVVHADVLSHRARAAAPRPATIAG